MSSIEVLKKLFGEEYIMKIIEARRTGRLALLGDPIAAIKEALDTIRERPDFPAAEIQGGKFTVMLVEVPINKEVFIKQTSTGNWKLGVLCGGQWVSLFAPDFDSLNELESGEMYFVITDKLRKREVNGVEFFSANLLYSIKLSDFEKHLS